MKIGKLVLTPAIMVLLLAVPATPQNLTLPGNVTWTKLRAQPGVFKGYGDLNGVAATYTATVSPPSLTSVLNPPPGSWVSTILSDGSPNGAYRVGWAMNASGDFSSLWVNASGVAQTLLSPIGDGYGQLFGVTDAGEVAGTHGLPVGGNVNTGLTFLNVPAGTGAGAANAIATAPGGEVVRAGTRADASALHASLWINTAQYDLPATTPFAGVYGLSDTGNRAGGSDGGVATFWNINVSSRTFSQIIPRDAANLTVSGLFNSCHSTGLCWGSGNLIGAMVFDPPSNQVITLLAWLNRYAIPHSFGSTNPSDVWSIAYDPSTGKIAVATPGSLNVTIGNSPAAIFGPDVNGDGVADCTDVAIVRAAFGKRPGQIGWNPQADVNRDNVVNIRDLAIVRRGLPAGTSCP